MNKDKNSIIQKTFNLAVKNHTENNLDVAKNLYKKVIEINPNHEDAHNNLGVIFYNLGEYQKAKSCYEKVIKINPNSSNTFYNLGLIFYRLRELQKAKEYYEKAIEINSNYADAHNNLGGVFNELGELEKAKNCYERAIDINPTNFSAYNNVGNIFKEWGDNQKAIGYYEKAIEINPKHLNTYNNLGAIFHASGDHLKAISFFERAIEIDPSNIDSINGLLLSLELFEPDNKLQDKKNNLKNLFIFLLRNNNIDHTVIANKAIKLFILNSDQIESLIDSSTSLIKNEFVQKILKEEILHLILQKSLILDELVEKLVTKLRFEILFSLDGSNKNISKEYFNFIVSLAEQSWLNEYVYPQSEEESDYINNLKQEIKNDEQIDEIKISILGCYTPLNDSKTIAQILLNHKSKNILFNDLINVQIKEPLIEKKLIKSMKSLDKIVDPVSKEVQEQYEENPYPRWKYTKRYLPKNFCERLNSQIKPNQINHNDRFNNPNVLVAGCGTGSHPISAARYKNANILGVDLSLASLAYAKRKTEELNYKNISYLHADILQLKKLNQKFDIIESSGVLHHMKDPVAGLKVLLDILEPHGFLRLGLYSEFARQNVVKARALIKDKNFKNTNEDIKKFRQLIIDDKEDHELRKLINSDDFYSTSAIRDLLFHIQEHRFTIPEISIILKDFNLEFLGFDMPNPSVKEEYSKIFPDDKKNISLDNWNQFEINNPETFATMYQFWVRKT